MEVHERRLYSATAPPPIASHPRIPNLTRASVKLGKGIEEFFGAYDENLKLLEKNFGVSTHLGDEALEIEGQAGDVDRAQRLVEEYSDLVERGMHFDPADVQSYLRILSQDPALTLKGL